MADRREHPSPAVLPDRPWPLTSTELLALFAPSTRAAAGLLIFALADQLVAMTEDELAKFGVATADAATGLLDPDEIEVAEPWELEVFAGNLCELIAEAGLWDREIAGD
jgi:hypothetical protein